MYVCMYQKDQITRYAYILYAFRIERVLQDIISLSQILSISIVRATYSAYVPAENTTGKFTAQYNLFKRPRIRGNLRRSTFDFYRLPAKAFWIAITWSTVDGEDLR